MFFFIIGDFYWGFWSRDIWMDEVLFENKGNFNRYREIS